MVTTVSKNSELKVAAKAERNTDAIAGACVSFFAGAILAVASIALWMIEVLEDRSFHRLEVCFPIASFLLFITGAHFLDKIDARKAKEYK